MQPGLGFPQFIRSLGSSTTNTVIHYSVPVLSNILTTNMLSPTPLQTCLGYPTLSLVGSAIRTYLVRQ